MGRGRPRQRDLTIPAHIDQLSIPRGVYWKAKDRVWYTLVSQGEGKQSWKRLGGPEATLADLQASLEATRGVDRASLGWLCDEFHGSDQFKRLAEKTREDYDAQRKIIATYQTKRGMLQDLPYASLTPVFVQKLIDTIGSEYPSKANHVLRYVRRVYSWGRTRRGCKTNPAKGVEQAVERKQQRLPKEHAYMALLNHAKANYPAYLWIATELAFLMRLRGIETVTLDDTYVLEEGMLTNRRKGSADSVIEWSPRLREAVRAAGAERSRIWSKKKMPTPLDPRQRPILVNIHGKPVSRHTLSTLWQTCIKDAIQKGLISPDDRFAIHDAKRKGVTETVGDKAAKKAGSGHKSDSMLGVYDKSIPRVSTPGSV